MHRGLGPLQAPSELRVRVRHPVFHQSFTKLVDGPVAQAAIGRVLPRVILLVRQLAWRRIKLRNAVCAVTLPTGRFKEAQRGRAATHTKTQHRKIALRPLTQKRTAAPTL